MARQGRGEGREGEDRRRGERERQSLESGLNMASEVSCLKPHSEVISCCCFTPHGTMHDAQQSYGATLLNHAHSLFLSISFFPHIFLSATLSNLSPCVHSLDTSFFAFLLSLFSPLYPSLSLSVPLFFLSFSIAPSLTAKP